MKYLLFLMAPAAFYFFVWPRLKRLIWWYREGQGWHPTPYTPPRYSFVWENGGFTVNHVTPLSKSKRAWIEKEFKEKKKAQKAYDSRQEHLELVERQLKKNKDTLESYEKSTFNYDQRTVEFHRKEIAKYEQQLMNLARLQEIHREKHKD